MSSNTVIIDYKDFDPSKVIIGKPSVKKPDAMSQSVFLNYRDKNETKQFNLISPPLVAKFGIQSANEYNLKVKKELLKQDQFSVPLLVEKGSKFYEKLSQLDEIILKHCDQNTFIEGNPTPLKDIPNFDPNVPALYTNEYNPTSGSGKKKPESYVTFKSLLERNYTPSLKLPDKESYPCSMKCSVMLKNGESESTFFNQSRERIHVSINPNDDNYIMKSVPKDSMCQVILKPYMYIIPGAGKFGIKWHIVQAVVSYSAGALNPNVCAIPIDHEYLNDNNSVQSTEVNTTMTHFEMDPTGDFDSIP